MKNGLLALSGLLVILAACGKSPEPKESAKDSGSSGNPLTAPVDYLGAIGRAQKSAVGTIDVTSLNKSIELFYATEDRFPKDLNELITMRYLPKLPDAPYGTRITYDPVKGRVAIMKLPPAAPAQ
ncbi:MAG: hypothetical protein O2960_22750 [Verrucomicrobia bacterium]|nr:hypothetical protein [Verrucomicrobiota bacterium]